MLCKHRYVDTLLMTVQSKIVKVDTSRLVEIRNDCATTVYFDGESDTFFGLRMTVFTSRMNVGLFGF